MSRCEPSTRETLLLHPIMLHSQRRQTVSNSVKQNTYLKQPANRARGEVVEARGEPGQRKGGDPAGVRALQMHPGERERERESKCATAISQK
ncbi:hypothetical protein EYF80_063589 [Liparis tanakae]|uniref:Uncharacterized protein n=1 Tax=Liparis tanakae TaxID=230148 RepID=A0A4Z2ECM7_9TELE|nr:hypothetical protein EYF80_063589 [Liparis tanakae]